MLPRRGICFTCRTRLHVASRASLPARTPRQFSSISRLPSHRLRLNSSQDASSARLAFPRLSPFVPFSQTRLQSTVPNPSQGDPSLLAPTSAVPESSSVYTLNPTSDPLSQWQIGYLAENGLDFGWGPSSMMQWAFEHLQVWSGYEVGVTIMLLALIQRLLTFPLVLQASDTSARFRALSPQIAHFQTAMRTASQEGDVARVRQIQRHMANLRAQNGIKLWKLALPMIQMPLGFGAWRMLRNAAFLPAPGFTTGGFLWFQNLVIGDPFFLLPICTGLTQHLTVRLGGEVGNAAGNPTFMKIMLYVLPVMSVVFTSAAPAAVQITFLSTSSLTLLTNLLLRSNSVRAFFGVAPRVATVKSPEQLELERRQKQAESVYKGTITIAKNQSSRVPSKAEAEAPPRRESPLSRLNPRTWLKSARKLGDEASRATGGAVDSMSDQRKKRELDAAREKHAAFEKQRAAERKRQKAEFNAKHGR